MQICGSLYAMKSYPNVTLRLSPEIHAWILGLAETEKMSVGQYIKRAMERSFEKAQKSEKTVFGDGPSSAVGPEPDWHPTPSKDRPKPACRHWHRQLGPNGTVCTDCGEKL